MPSTTIRLSNRDILMLRKQALKMKNRPILADAVTTLSKAEAVDLVKTIFASATERDIYTGDRLKIVVLNADGIRREYMELKKD